MRTHAYAASLHHGEAFIPGTQSAPAGRDSVSGKHLRILLVEDHEDTRRAMERLLERWGHDVHCAANITGALDYASANEFDLLLSDIGLPDGTGVELLKKLRGLHPVRAVAMSGFGEEADRAATREAGFEEHLLKPVAWDRLKQVIERLGDAR